jgi:DNA replication protein DnaC
MSNTEAEAVVQAAAARARDLSAQREALASRPFPQARQLDAQAVVQAMVNKPVMPADDYLARSLLPSELEKAGVPKRYRNIDLDDLSRLPEEFRPVYSDAIKRSRRIVYANGILLLIGHRGPGKTAIGCGIVREFIAKKKWAVYLECMDFFLAVKRTYGGNTARDETDVEREYLRPHLLVIDSVEERGDTAWEDRLLTRLINKRYAAELPTILISNDSAKGAAKRLGDSIVTRIMDGGGKVECTWPSLRGRIAAEAGR